MNIRLSINIKKFFLATIKNVSDVVMKKMTTMKMMLMMLVTMVTDSTKKRNQMGEEKFDKKPGSIEVSCLIK